MTSEEREKAMDRIRDEMAKHPDEPLAEIGEYMTERLMAEEETGAEDVAAAVLNTDKSLAGAFGKIREAAAKARKGGAACVCIGPAEASRIVCGYYGIPEVSAGELGRRSGGRVSAAEEPEKNANPQTSADLTAELAASLDLDALLGGL